MLGSHRTVTTFGRAMVKVTNSVTIQLVLILQFGISAVLLCHGRRTSTEYYIQWKKVILYVCTVTVAYKITRSNRTQATWQEAADYCIEHGMRLASIESRAERLEVKSTVKVAKKRLEIRKIHLVGS